MNCIRCGKPLEIEEAAFCPFCGAPVPRETEAAGGREALEWAGKMKAAGTIPQKEQILREARAACPDSFPIEWEALFIGRGRGKRRDVDFFRIKSYLLQMYLRPKEFDEKVRAENRAELFGDPQLLRCLELSGDPEGTLPRYLDRLCAEYIDFFLEGDSRVSRTFLGFRLDRSPEKYLAAPAAKVLAGILADEGLTTEQREQLKEAFLRAYGKKTKGAVAPLEEALRGYRLKL